MGTLIALTLLLITGVWGIKKSVHALKDPVEMSFTATGEYLITNSMVKVSFTFSDINENITASHNKVTGQVRSAYATLTQLDVNEKDIKTTGYTIHPEYEYTPAEVRHTGKRKLLGYRVSHSSTVTVRNLDKVSVILNAITNLEPTDMTGPTFTSTEEERRRAEETATASAIRNAKHRAQKIAQMSDLRLKKMIHIRTYDNNPIPYGKLETRTATLLSDSAVSESVPIYQGENKIQKTATITYEIKETGREGGGKITSTLPAFQK